jgi:hypothetical protein
MPEGLPALELYSDDGSGPGSSLGFLISPSEESPWSATNVTFGGNGLALAAGTPYWIVLKSPWFAWRATTTTACDPATCGVAFSPGSVHTDDTGVWWSDTWVLRTQVSVNEAADLPEPAAFWLFLPLAALPLCRRRT